MKNLLIVVHPNYEKSVVNRMIVEALAQAKYPNLTIKNLYTLYPDRKINIAQEQKDLLAADRIIFQFPLYWYSSPSLLKDWLDAVLTPGFAYAYGDEKGFQLKGKHLLISTTAAGFAEKYTALGANRFTIPEFLRPFDATAHFCKMHFETPLVSHGIFPHLSAQEVAPLLAEHLEKLKKIITA